MEQVFINGVVLAVNYALIALGITLIFSIMNILNFGHGQMFMIGGFVVYYLYGIFKINYFVSLIAVFGHIGLGAKTGESRAFPLRKNFYVLADHDPAIRQNRVHDGRIAKFHVH